MGMFLLGVITTIASICLLGFFLESPPHTHESAGDFWPAADEDEVPS